MSPELLATVAAPMGFVAVGVVLKGRDLPLPEPGVKSFPVHVNRDCATKGCYLNSFSVTFMRDERLDDEGVLQFETPP